MSARLEHVGLWVADIDRVAEFYAKYFGAQVGELYRNARKGFESRFVSFSSGARLEIMRTTSFCPVEHDAGAQRMGLTHLALSVGSESQVNQLTERLRSDGHPVVDGPRRTGDGYFESVILDPDGNRVEICA